MIKVEFCVIVKCLRGAFKGFGNWQKAKSCFTQYLHSETEKNILFGLVYELICLCWNDGHHPAGYGSPGHMKKTWLLLRVSSLWRGPGSDLKVGRWLATPQKKLALQSHLGELLLALLVLGTVEWGLKSSRALFYAVGWLSGGDAYIHVMFMCMFISHTSFVSRRTY